MARKVGKGALAASPREIGKRLKGVLATSPPYVTNTLHKASTQWQQLCRGVQSFQLGHCIDPRGDRSFEFVVAKKPEGKIWELDVLKQPINENRSLENVKDGCTIYWFCGVQLMQPVQRGDRRGDCSCESVERNAPINDNNFT